LPTLQQHQQQNIESKATKHEKKPKSSKKERRMIDEFVTHNVKNEIYETERKLSNLAGAREPATGHVALTTSARTYQLNLICVY
jgi:hypothetical protein